MSRLSEVYCLTASLATASWRNAGKCSQQGLAFRVGWSVLLTAGLVAICGCRQPASTARDTSLTLKVPEEDLKLGRVWSGTKISKLIHIRNDSDEPVVIRDIRASCGCTTLTPFAFTIEARREGLVTAAIDLTGLVPEAGQTLLEVQLVPALDHYWGSLPAWLIRADVEKLLTVSKTSARFDEVVTRPNFVTAPPTDVIDVKDLSQNSTSS
jgi:hypothetical protein